MAMQDFTGQKFNRLTAVRFLRWKNFKCGQRKQVWEFRCECGNLTETLIQNVRRGHTQSCGCFQAQRRKESHTTHGQYVGGSGPSRPMSIWNGMVQRCSDPNSTSFEYYGAKGIKVEWSTFEDFWSDMGPTYRDGLKIERIDNSQNYCKSNCCWATQAQQNRNYGRNRLLTHNGVTKPLVCWAEQRGIKPSTLWNRLHLGWSTQRAIETPVKNYVP